MEVVRAAAEGARTRLRPILMTSGAMIAGMVPMALGMSEGGEQAASLGRAVIGGLIGSLPVTLFILPAAFAMMRGKNVPRYVTMHPDDPESLYYEAGAEAP
jgi:multidrug efflux pump subunit AcrB